MDKYRNWKRKQAQPPAYVPSSVSNTGNYGIPQNDNQSHRGIGVPQMLATRQWTDIPSQTRTIPSIQLAQRSQLLFRDKKHERRWNQMADGSMIEYIWERDVMSILIHDVESKTVMKITRTRRRQITTTCYHCGIINRDQIDYESCNYR